MLAVPEGERAWIVLTYEALRDANPAWERLFGRPYLRAVVACGPLGLLAVEAGWVVTESGRQPWVVQGMLRTETKNGNAT